MDLQEAFDAGFVAVKAYVDDALDAQTKTLPDLIKAAVAEAVAALPVPKDGADADPALVERMVAEAVAALPKAKDGGDGASFDPETLKAAVEEAVAAIPTPRDGESITAEDVAPMVAEAVERAVAAIPPARDGIGMVGALIDKDGGLVITLTDGTLRELGRVVGRDGIDAKGEPGRDALTLTDFDTELSEDGRILTLSLENDEVKVTHKLQLPTMIYRGVFKDGTTYVQGDTVTFGGSLWHCNAETADKPIDGNPAWTLATKRGRDGKDAKS